MPEEDSCGSVGSRLAETPVDLGPAGFLLPKTESCGVCGRLFLARLPKVLPAAQAESGLLEGED